MKVIRVIIYRTPDLETMETQLGNSMPDGTRVVKKGYSITIYTVKGMWWRRMCVLMGAFFK